MPLFGLPFGKSVLHRRIMNSRTCVLETEVLLIIHGDNDFEGARDSFGTTRHTSATHPRYLSNTQIGSATM